jgi:anti-anti-sigma factor
VPEDPTAHRRSREGAAADGRPETPRQRLDRNLEEMTGELRVVVTGVQVLFAFLLVVPFDSGFAGIGPFERTVYLATLVCAALATLCVMMPAAYHRVLFRQDDKRHVVFLANRVALAGLALLAVAMCGSVLLVTTKLFGAGAGALTAGLLGGTFVLLWFLAPLVRRRDIGVSIGVGAPRQDSQTAENASRAAVKPDVNTRLAKRGVRYDARVGAQEHLRVEVRQQQDRVVLHLEGELDLASSPILERALEGVEVAATALLVLDLDELRFVDSTGLRIILLAHESARGRGQEFAITPGSPQVQRLLSITSVAEHMRVIASPDDLLV